MTMIFIKFLILCFSFRVNDGAPLYFDLSAYNSTNTSTHVDVQLMKLNFGITQGVIVNVPKNVGFYLIQVHCHDYNVTLSPNREFLYKTTVTGTNIGLVYFQNDSSLFFIENRKFPTEALVAITIYGDDDPIPGGCNMSFDTKVAPYQIVSYDSDLITVLSQPPSMKGWSCSGNNVAVDFYHLFLHQYYDSSNDYYEAIQKMMTVDGIEKYGTKVRTLNGYFKYKKLYNLYRGTGEVFAIIARYKNRSSVYVPAISYGCDTYNWYENCRGAVTNEWNLIALVASTLGTYLCFLGHKHFRLTLYLFGFIAGVFVTYLVLSASAYFTFGEKGTYSLLNGLVYGWLWLAIWDKFGVPLISVSLTFLMAGFLATSTLFYAGLGDTVFYVNDINCGLTAFCLILTCFILLTIFTMHGHIFACSFVGVYFIILAMNYYFGGHLQYILITSFRRLTAHYFGNAIIDPPYQFLDFFHTMIWIILVGAGFYYQCRHQRGKPPFPRPRSTVEEGISEGTVLIRDSNNPPYYVM